MRELNGAEIAGFIKERQARAVRGLKQAWHTDPKLAIIVTKDDPVTDTYTKLKSLYADEIGVTVETYKIKQSMVPDLLDEMRKDESIHGIILQLPLDSPSETEQLCALIPVEKDVDGLSGGGQFISATATAIDWLINGYGISYSGKQVLIIGQGKLVGKPFAELLKSSGYAPQVADENTADLPALVKQADIIVTATGQPGSITASMLKQKAVVVDAGVATSGGKLAGDLAADVYTRDDITVTPVKGGVGPLTIAALMENVIIAARGNTEDSAKNA